MSETMTTSSTGGVKGVKPQRYDLLPKAGLDAIAEVFGFGAEKYESHNWRRCYEWSKSYAAAMRHLTAHWDGETLDPESGLPHLAHAGCHMLFMLTWLNEQGEGGEFDDRYRRPATELSPPSPARARVLGDSAKMGHPFQVGQLVMAGEVEIGGLVRCEFPDGYDYWWVHVDDLEWAEL